MLASTVNERENSGFRLGWSNPHMSESIFLHPQNGKLFLSVNLQKRMTCFCRVLGERSGLRHNFDHPCQTRLAGVILTIHAHEISRGRHFVNMCCGWICLRRNVDSVRTNKPRHSVLIEMSDSIAEGEVY